MSIPTITRTSSAHWLQRGIVAAGALLIASTITFGLANRTSMNPAPAGEPATRMRSTPSAAHLRYHDFKLHQIAALDAVGAQVKKTTSSAARLRYVDLKQRQIAGLERPSPRSNRIDASAYAGYVDFKLGQVDWIEMRGGVR